MSKSLLIAKNTLANSVSGIVVQLLSVVTGVLVARFFGVVGYGELAFANVFTSYIMMGTDFGMTSISIRRMSQDKGNYKDYLFTHIISRALLSLLAYGVLVAIVFLGKFSPLQGSLILLYGTLLLPRIMSVNWVFVAHQKMEYSGICSVLEKATYVVLIVVGFLFYRKIYMVPIAMTLSSLLGAGVGWYFLKTKFAGAPMTRFDRSFFRELFVHSWPVGISNGASQVNNNLDTIFIKNMSGSAATGEYGAAYRLVNFMVMIGNFFTSAMYPLVCERVTGERTVLAQTVDRATRILLMFFVPLACFLTILGPHLLVMVFGQEFSGGGAALQVLVWAALFLLVSRFYGNVLTALNRQGRFMFIMVSSALVNIVLNVILIPRYGIVGAAWATLITEALILCAAIIATMQFFPVRPLMPVVRLLPACTVMVALTYGIAEYWWWVALVVAPLSYVLTLYLTGGVSAEEILLLKSFIRKISGRTGRAG